MEIRFHKRQGFVPDRQNRYV